ncbi:MAG: polysaccharide deacetylase family protein [Actinomycetota bacterium]
MKRLTLSFDNGPSPDTTPQVLAELGRRGISAYFFVVGRQLAKPGGVALAQRARNEGHIVANHSMTHSVPLGLSGELDHVEVEIEQTERLLSEAGLAPQPPIFRPFGLGGQLGSHLLSDAARDHLQEHGYTVVLWNSVPRDWEDTVTWPVAAAADVERHDHTVMVLHDLPTGAMAQLPEFLDSMMDRGVEFTLDLPKMCVPMRAGEPSPTLVDFVAAN